MCGLCAGHSSPSLDAQLPTDAAPSMQLHKSAVFSDLTIELVHNAHEEGGAFDLGASVMEGPPDLPPDPEECRWAHVTCSCDVELSVRTLRDVESSVDEHVTYCYGYCFSSFAIKMCESTSRNYNHEIVMIIVINLFFSTGHRCYHPLLSSPEARRACQSCTR
jgi:hypothetical protein